MTPEGRVKKFVSEFLERELHLVKLGGKGGIFNPQGFYWMPVPSGYGVSYLDYIGHYKGKFFGIETKAPGEKPTPRQNQAIELTYGTGAVAFVIDELKDLEEIRQWRWAVDRIMKGTD